MPELPVPTPPPVIVLLPGVGDCVPARNVVNAWSDEPWEPKPFRSGMFVTWDAQWDVTDGCAIRDRYTVDSGDMTPRNADGVCPVAPPSVSLPEALSRSSPPSTSRPCRLRWRAMGVLALPLTGDHLGGASSLLPPLSLSLISRTLSLPHRMWDRPWMALATLDFTPAFRLERPPAVFRVERQLSTCAQTLHRLQKYSDIDSDMDSDINTTATTTIPVTIMYEPDHRHNHQYRCHPHRRRRHHY